MVHTSVEDLQKWDENFYSAEIGGKDFLAELQEPGKLNNGRPLKYAKGLFIRNYRGLPTIWHGGESAGYFAYLLRFPEQHFSVACLCNGPFYPWRRAHRIAHLYLGGLMKRGEVDFATAGPDVKSPASLTAQQVWSGNYRNSKNEDILQVTEKEGTLWLDFEGIRRQLRALSNLEFETLGSIYETRLKFESTQSGTPRKLIVTREMEPPATFEAVEPPMLPTTELAAYVGDYWSEELQVTYHLALTDGKLWMKDLIGSDGIVHRGIIPSNELRPISAGDFALNGAPLFFRFGRDEKGNLSGFVLNGFSERGILFTRLGKAK
jgi:hypothetical protein